MSFKVTADTSIAEWNPRVRQVIEMWALRGEGTEQDPMRRVLQLFDLDGNFLAERDQAAEKLAKLEGR